ncbi:MAG: transposase [Candidatus Marinimicrobia bacterium]|nr:transposase [Candidatus Neomarinimicrobiota bacterium]
MSGPGNSYDNAVAESFCTTLKTELMYHEQCQTAFPVRQSVFEYSEVFYNRYQKHSTLGYLSPEEYIQSRRKNAPSLQGVHFFIATPEIMWVELNANIYIYRMNIPRFYEIFTLTQEPIIVNVCESLYFKYEEEILC